jgi:hypothetical protein
MFSDDQMSKISYFASITKITNECFRKCVNFNFEEGKDLNPNKSLSEKEVDCLKSCSQSFLKLRKFVETQLFEDWDSIKRKNKKIYDDET